MYNAYEMDSHIQKHQADVAALLESQASKRSFAKPQRKPFKFRLMQYEISIRPVKS